MIQRILMLLALTLYTLAGHGQEHDRHPFARERDVPTVRDTTVVILFPPGSTDLYAQKGFVTLDRLIARYRRELDAGQLLLRVDAYHGSAASPQRDKLLARERGRQLKSYLIIQNGLREQHFLTRYHPVRRDGQDTEGVTVQLVPSPVSAAPPTPSPVSSPPQSHRPLAYTRPRPNELPHPRTRRPWNIAVKTNLLLDLATVTNLGIEIQLTPRLTADLPVLFSPFRLKADYHLQVLALQPEIRYWFRHPFSGSYLGLHGNIGWYNIALDTRYRYQDREAAYGLGLSYGYSRLFTPRWGLEFTAGAGYLHLRYSAYYNIPRGARYNTYTLHYWGITRLGINLFHKF